MKMDILKPVSPTRTPRTPYHISGSLDRHTDMLIVPLPHQPITLLDIGPSQYKAQLFHKQVLIHRFFASIWCCSLMTRSTVGIFYCFTVRVATS